MPLMYVCSSNVSIAACKAFFLGMSSCGGGA